jgi:hypothetical protein
MGIVALLMAYAVRVRIFMVMDEDETAAPLLDIRSSRRSPTSSGFSCIDASTGSILDITDWPRCTSG